MSWKFKLLSRHFLNVRVSYFGDPSGSVFQLPIIPLGEKVLPRISSKHPTSNSKPTYSIFRHLCVEEMFPTIDPHNFVYLYQASLYPCLLEVALDRVIELWKYTAIKQALRPNTHADQDAPLTLVPSVCVWLVLQRCCLAY